MQLVPMGIPRPDDVAGVDDTGDVAQQCQQDVQPEGSTQAPMALSSTATARPPFRRWFIGSPWM